MIGKHVGLALAAVLGGTALAAPALAQNEQFIPALVYRTGAYAPNGVPFGIQLTGPRFADDLLLAVGAAWEAAHPWPLSAPGFEPFGR